MKSLGQMDTLRYQMDMASNSSGSRTKGNWLTPSYI